MDRVTFATKFKNHSFSFWRNTIFIGEHRLGWKPDGQIISLSNFGSARQSVLTCGTVSRDWPRDIFRIQGNLKSTDYLQILERASEGNFGRNVAHLPTPVNRSRTVAEWFSSAPLNCLSWPTKIQDIFPLTTFWKYFLFELRMSPDVVGNVEILWAEIYQCWDDFIQKDDIVDAVTTGYLWIDLSNIAEAHY